MQLNFKRSASEQKLAAARVQNPPSIPSHLSVFGYEENENGHLIKQRSNQVGFTGVKADKVGPGDYEIHGAKKVTGKSVTGVVQWKKPTERPAQAVEAIKMAR